MAGREKKLVSLGYEELGTENGWEGETQKAPAREACGEWLVDGRLLEMVDFARPLSRVRLAGEAQAQCRCKCVSSVSQ